MWLTLFSAELWLFKLHWNQLHSRWSGHKLLRQLKTAESNCFVLGELLVRNIGLWADYLVNSIPELSSIVEAPEESL